MIAVVTHHGDATADFMCARLDHERVAYLRLDTDQIANSVRISFADSMISFRRGICSIGPNDVGCVWLRRPKPIAVLSPNSDASEAAHMSSEWGEALEGFLGMIPPVRWINHPSRNASASHKIEQLVSAKESGFEVPDTLVSQDPSEVQSFFERHQGRVVVKTLSGGYLERGRPEEDTQIFTSRVLRNHLEHVELVQRCPTLFQEEIGKALDVRVTVVDHRFTGVSLEKKDADGAQITDIRRDNMDGVRYRRMELPTSVTKSLMAMMRRYGLRFAAVDFAVDLEGRWIFLEVNPGGQWAWLDIAGITDIAGDLAQAMSVVP